MQEPSIPFDEAQRIATLSALNILDTPPEERFDRITRIAQHIFGVPIALVSLVDSNRQWFKSCQGLDASETPRNISFCGHAILKDEALIIEDTLQDARFADNPLVSNAPNIRFYAGQPLRARNGNRLGTLCVIDRKPRQLTQQDLECLRDLAAMAENELDVLDIHAANNALQDKENRLRAILNNVVDGIITINEQGKVESFNYSAEQIFGYSAAEVTGNNVNMLMPQPYHSQHDNYLHNYVSTGHKKIIGIGREVTGLRKNGTTFAMELAVSEMKIGTQRMFTGIVRDISRNKHAEEMLAVTNRLNQAILNSADHLIISTTTDGTILTFNHAAERALGYQSTELAGISSAAIFHDPDEVQHRAKELQNAGIAVEPGFEVFVALARRGEADTNEWCYIRKDGSRFPVMLTVTSLFDEQGDVTGFLGVATDISEQKKAAQALRETSLSLARAQQIAHIGNWSWNIETGQFDRSDEVFRISGLQPQQHDSTIETFINSVHPSDRELMQKAMYEAIEGEKFSIDHRILWPDGTERTVHEQGVVERNEAGKPIRLEGTIQDITERKLIERMKAEFISTVSHELRTPLTSIRGSLGLIAGGVAGELPAQAKALVDIAQKNSERLILLVNDILDMEKIEAGKMNFNLKPVELKSLVEQSLETNRAYAQQFNVKYLLLKDQDVPQVQIDADRFMQVMANLLSNAAKFSPAGSAVTVTVKSRDKKVRVSVNDRGQGIPEAFHNKIFQKFSQADSSDTRSKSGTGLGLSITKALVEGMGGQIGFTSELDKGTSFYVEFPAAVSPKNNLPEEERNTVTAYSNKRILICEDDQDVARLLQMMLEQAGYGSDIANTAVEAKSLLTQQRYHAITLDIMMPGQDGLSLLRELQSSEATPKTPVIVVSAIADEYKNDTASGIVVLDWISKPIDEKRLLSSLHGIAGKNKKPVILHVEDDEDISKVLLALIGNEGTVVAAHTLAEAKNKIVSTLFDLVILDLELSDGSGLDLLSFMSEKGIQAPVIVFSATELNAELVQQVKAILVKSRTSNEQLLARIKQIIEV